MCFCRFGASKVLSTLKDRRSDRCLEMERDVIIGILLFAVGGLFIGGLFAIIGFALVGLGSYYIITSVIKKISTPTAPKQSQA